MESQISTRIRQRSVIEFLFNSGDLSATVIHSKLKPVYGNETLDRSTIQSWVQHFQNGDFNISDKERPGRPFSVAIDQNLFIYLLEKHELSSRLQPSSSHKTQELRTKIYIKIISKQIYKIRIILHSSYKHKFKFLKKSNNILL